MNFVYYNFFALFIYLLASIILSIIIFGASYVLATQQPEVNKVAAYECGFDPFGDSRESFNIQYYLVAILFIIFDLEISFLFPWAVSFDVLTDFGLFIVIIYLIIITIGFFYEWRKGALEWE